MPMCLRLFSVKLDESDPAKIELQIVRSFALVLTIVKCNPLQDNRCTDSVYDEIVSETSS